MRKKLLSYLFLLALPTTVVAQQFNPTKEPVSPDGTQATCDIPVGQHIRNTGGSDSAGLCVYSSVELAARWHNLPDMIGFQKWMTKRPGGGYPEKLDKMIAQYCKEKGIPVPPFIQHTGGIEDFLDLAIKTHRMVGVTYAGMDDFYRSGVDHMVDLVHLDSTHAAIIDNNRPGNWVWMSRKDFLSRWRARGGGWAVVWLNAPPPPHLLAKTDAKCPCPHCKCDGCECSLFTKAPCICGDDCKCEKGKCPNKCLSLTAQPCPNGRCGVPFQQSCPNDSCGSPPSATGPVPFGRPPTADHVWGQFPDGVWGWLLKPVPEAKGNPVPPPIEKSVEAPAENYGLDRSKIHTEERYTLPNGQVISKGQAHAAIAAGGGLVDDSGKWHLSVVGDSTFLALVKGHLDKLTTDQKDKLHIQFYAPDHWAVSLYTLPAGVSLRKPSPARVSDEVGVISPKDFTLDQLLALLSLLDGKPKPTPLPIPVPVPVPSPQPAPLPVPVPVPVPNSDSVPTPISLPLLAILAGLLYLIFRKKDA